MENFGQSYTASAENIALPTNSATPYDLILFAAAAAVPLLLYRIIVTSPQTSALFLRMQLQQRSTASTGGTGLTPVNNSPAGPAASTTITYNNVTTTGTAAGTPQDAQQWNEFAPYEFNLLPSGFVVPAGKWCGLYLPSPPGTATVCSFRAEFIEVK